MKENKLNGVKKRIKWLWLNHKVFSVIIVVQLVLVLGAITCAFQAKKVVELPINGIVVSNNADDNNQYVIRNEGFPVTPGGYIVEVDYEIEDPTDQLSDFTSYIGFSSVSNGPSINSGGVKLTIGETDAKGKLWVQNIVSVDDLIITFWGEGNGTVNINSIILNEQLVYRWVCILMLIMLFGVLDFIYYLIYLSGNGSAVENLNKYKIPLLLGTVFMISMIPYLNNFVYHGDDIDFHLSRISALADELSYGQFPVRMMTELNNGYGYVTSIFYCDIFLYIPALLINCMIPVQYAYITYIGMVNLATILIAYYSFKYIVKDKEIAILGSVVYVFSAYRMQDVLRAAVGEYTAMTFLPLVIWGMWAIYQNEKITYKEWLPLSFGMTGIVLSHSISLQMTGWFLVIAVLIMFKKTFKIHRLFALLKASLFTVALSAWYLIPFVHSLLTWDVNVIVGAHHYLQSSGTYLVQLLGMVMHGVSGNVDGGTFDEAPLQIGWPLVFGFILAVYCLLYKEKWENSKENIFKSLHVNIILSIIAVCVTLQAFPWDTIGVLGGEIGGILVYNIQFAWRYLVIVSILLSFVTVLALSILKKNNAKVYSTSVKILLVLTIFVAGNYYSNYIHYNISRNVYDLASDYYTDALYALDDFGGVRQKITIPFSDSEELIVVDYNSDNGIFEVTCANDSQESIALIFPIFSYENYHVADIATGKEYEVVDVDNGQITVYLEAGYSGTLVVTYEAPVLWRISEMISIISLVGILILWKKSSRNLTLKTQEK